MATPNPFLNQYAPLVQDQFLETKNWIEKASSCRSVYSLYQETLKAASLMNHVLNINDESKKKILEIIAVNPTLILVKTKGDVKYCSSKQKKIVVRIRFNNLNPLEAAALSGDFHLVNIFKDALPDDRKHQAGLQLEAILSDPNFLCTFKALQEAYQKYLTEYAFDKPNNWTVLNEFWEQVGEAQKKLSTFALQVFCNPIGHYSSPNFTQEPVRVCYFSVYGNTVESDFDTFGFERRAALLKGKEDAACGAQMVCTSQGIVALKLDSDAIKLLAKVIPEQLGNTKALLLQYAPGSGKKSERAPSPSSASLDSDKALESAVRAAFDPLF